MVVSPALYHPATSAMKPELMQAYSQAGRVSALLSSRAQDQVRFQGKEVDDAGKNTTPFYRRAISSLWEYLQTLKIILAVMVFSWLPIPALRRFMERQFLYAPPKPVFKEELKSDAIKKRLKSEWFRSLDGTKLHGWYLKADPEAVAKNGKRPVILFAHGRATNIQDYEDIMKNATKRGYDIFVFDYRGFGNSEGTPDELGLSHDLEAASRFLTRKYKVPSREQVVMGYSLGGGVLSDVASRTPFKAVVITSSFTRLHDALKHQKDQANWLVRYIMSENLVRSQFNSLDKIADCKSPTLILCGDKDNVTPLRMGKTLFRSAPRTLPKAFAAVPGCDHDTVFSKGGEIMMDHLDAFIDRLASEKGKAV